MIARIDHDDTLPLDQVVHGECLSVMRSFPDNSVDSICADPPSSIHFMGKTWDNDRGGKYEWIAWLAAIMREALRCVKPGGHAFIWALPRTSHMTAEALEQAGWEIREKHYHLFGSGFPKSLDIGKAIHKQLGIEREVIGQKMRPDGKRAIDARPNGFTNTSEGWDRPWKHDREAVERQASITASSPELQQYEGLGSATKPAAEEWILCRKPLSEKTLALNCLKWGTGGLNIDKSRVSNAGMEHHKTAGSGAIGTGHGIYSSSKEPINSKQIARANAGLNPRYEPLGRFPSHVLFSHSLFCTDTVCDESCPVLALEQQSGVRKSGALKPYTEHHTHISSFHMQREKTYTSEASTGTASRFFHCFTPDVPFLYCAKSSRSERNLGCEELEERDGGCLEGNADMNNARKIGARPDIPVRSTQNTHPTVKSLSLMKYLCNLICPPDGIVLDMFFGSGSTGVAALQSGLHFIGIEQELEYVTIARARIAHAMRGET